MATQGLLTITKNGKTHIKVVVSSDGNHIGKLANIIKNENLWNKPQSLWDACDRAKFGTILNGRVIQHGKDGKLLITNHDSSNGSESSVQECDMKLYYEKWNDPKFNPRWECGMAAHVLVLEAP